MIYVYIHGRGNIMNLGRRTECVGEEMFEAPLLAVVLQEIIHCDDYFNNCRRAVQKY